MSIKSQTDTMPSFWKQLVLVWLVCSLGIIKAIEDSTPVFRQLIDTFQNITDRHQYAVLYMTRQPGGSSPTFPQNQLGSRPVLFPGITNIQPGHIPTEYPHFVAAARTDHRAQTYGSIIEVTGRHLHAEEILLNIVYPGMLTWFRRVYGEPTDVYLYTYYFPCTYCMDDIQYLIEQDNRINFHVAFTMYEINAEAATAMTVRQPRLDETLHNNGGELLPEISGPSGTCFLPGSSSRSKRDVGLCTDESQFVLLLDFTNGKAQVRWYQPRKTYGAIGSRAWLGLYNENGSRITYVWASQSASREPTTQTFNAYMSERYEVRLYDGGSTFGLFGFTLRKTSFRFDKCGFKRSLLNNVPVYYNDVWIWLSISDGYPVVHLKFSNGRNVASGSDWVVLQNEEDAYTNDHDRHMWEYVTSMHPDGENTYTYKFGYRLYDHLRDGFRVKYVYSYWSYQWKEIHDNATPFWTPSGCIGTGA